MENREIADYKILEEHEYSELAESVNESIKNGWQPFGGVSAYTYGTEHYCQAMVKYDYGTLCDTGPK